MKKMNHSVRTVTLKRGSRHDTVRSKAHRFLNTVQTAGRLRGLDVKEFCDSYGVNQDTFTRLTGFSPRAVAHWAQGRKPSVSTERRLAELGRLFEELEKFVASETIGPWLKEPNPAFDGSTPLQVVERGEADRISRMLYELESGEPG
jgi:DNA-binding transcriptional regulator YiaG